MVCIEMFPVVTTVYKSTSPIGFVAVLKIKYNNEYFIMVANNSVQIGLVTVLRIRECWQILSWDTLIMFAPKYREVY